MTVCFRRDPLYALPLHTSGSLTLTGDYTSEFLFDLG